MPNQTFPTSAQRLSVGTRMIYTVSDSLGLCAFTTTASYGATPERCARLFSALTGIPMEADQIMWAGQRILTLERLINPKLGWREDPSSYAPWWLMNERQEALDIDDPILDVEKMRSMVKEYYTLHGWDKETGVPGESIIKELRLSDSV